MGDGQVKRMNMLKTLGEKEKSDWKAHLPKLAFAHNATKNKATGYGYAMGYGYVSVELLSTGNEEIGTR